jgi:hypothetical protein
VPDVKRQWFSTRLQVAIIALLGLLGLPAFSPYIGAGLDSSWVIAVSLAVNRHLAFGRSLIFSYGPLGFLATPAFVVPAMGVVSMWVRVGFALLLGWLIARSVVLVAPFWATAIITVVSVWMLGGAFALGGEAVLVPLVLLLGGLVDFLATAKLPMKPVTATVLGSLVGTMLLTKFDTGLWGMLFLLAALVFHARSIRLGVGGTLRRLALATLGFVGAVLVWWGALSQPIGALGPWLRGSTEVLLGYDRAMVANGGLWWELPAALVACAATVVLSWMLTPVSRRSYVCIFVLAVSWLFTKQSFIRHDNGHVVRIFVLLAFALLLLLGARRRWEHAEQIPLFNEPVAQKTWAIAMVTVVGCLAMVGRLTTYGRLQTVLPDPGMVPRAVRWIGDPNQVDLDRKGLLKNLNIGSGLRKELGKGSLHIEPSETSVVLGLPELTWNPLPVPQSYSAYTPWLDQRNAKALSSSTGPEQVLYESSSVDGRVSRFESPAAMVSLICHYRSVYKDKRWTLFRRNDVTLLNKVNPANGGNAEKVANPSTSSNTVPPFNACEGPTFELKSLIGKFGQRLDLDIEGLDEYLIVGRFDGFEVTNQTRLQELATRPAQFWFRIGDKNVGTPGRFVPATAGAPHILSMPACLRGKLGKFDSGLYTNFALFDAPPTSKRVSAKDRANYRVRLEALPFKCPEA